MPTPRTLSCQYSQDPSVVMALLVDPNFLRRHAEASGGTNIEVDVQSTDDRVVVRVVHDVEVELPAFLKRIFKPKNRIAQEEVWQRVDHGWESDFEVTIGGVPSEVKGRTFLKPVVEGGCVHEAAFQVKARLPVIAGRLENFVADQIEESIRAEFERNAKALVR